MSISTSSYEIWSSTLHPSHITHTRYSHHLLNCLQFKSNKNLISKTNQPQARIAADLKELRNSSVFAFFMINALFVLIVFLLQLNKDNIHVKWPLGVKTNITYDETTQEVKYGDAMN